jgi:hypothetical protein
VGLDLHTFGNRIGTGGNQVPHALHFHNANPAGAGGGKVFQITEGGDLESRASSDLKDHFTFIRLNRLTVDFNRNHVYLLYTFSFQRSAVSQRLYLFFDYSTELTHLDAVGAPDAFFHNDVMGALGGAHDRSGGALILTAMTAMNAAFRLDYYWPFFFISFVNAVGTEIVTNAADNTNFLINNRVPSQTHNFPLLKLKLLLL